MRKPEVESAWQKFRQLRSKASGVKTITHEGIVGLAADTINFTSPFTAICGLNGVGKSALIKALLTAIDPEQGSRTQGSFNRIVDAKVDVRLYVKGQEKDYSYRREHLRPPNEKAEQEPLSSLITEAVSPIVKYFDAASEVINLQNFFAGITSIEDALNGIGMLEITSTDLSMINYISGKNYDRAEIYEVDSFDPPRTYFKVWEEGAAYELGNMSFGEISCFLLFWAIKQARNGTLFLLEEPETYISPSAQEKLADYLVSLCVSKQHSFVVTTHSPKLIRSLNAAELKLLVPSKNGSKLVTDEARQTLLQHIGLEPHKSFICFVEDRAAREFVKALLYYYDRNLLSDADILDIDGEANITTILKILPQQRGQLSFVGIYDADMSGKVPPVRWPTMFLPFGQTIEKIFLSLVRENTAVLAAELGCSENSLLMAHTANRGLDAHDCFIEIGKAIHCGHERLIISLVSTLMHDSSNDQIMRDFCVQLNNLARKN